MPWNETTRREYARCGRRYASDLTEREWALVAPFLPAPKKIGRPRTTELRDVLDASSDVLNTEVSYRERTPDQFNIRNPESSKLMTQTGWRPTVSLQQGLTDLKEYFEGQEAVLHG